MYSTFFFFFQAEDGIRDVAVTGVQTCALPISGPFLFDSWSLDQYIRMKKNPNYWQEGRPYLDEIEIRNMPDYTTSVMAFKAGEVDMVESIDPAQYNELKAQGYTVDIPKGLRFVFCFRHANADPNSPFSKKEVREALWYAVDREGLVF